MAAQGQPVRGKTEPTQSAWNAWAQQHERLLAAATPAQQALLEAAVRIVAACDGHALMVRLVAFLLLHAHMGLTAVQVGAAVGRTDRAMRTVQALTVRQLLDSMWNELGRHRRPKLLPEHAGPIAKYLVDHPDCTQPEVVAFLFETFHIRVDPQTLRRFMKKYGLGVLREPNGNPTGKEPPERPFELGTAALEEPSSFYRLRCR
jgi:hypothetical protein